MVNPGGVGGGPRFTPQQRVGDQKKDTKESKETKDSKGAEGKGEVRGGQAGGVRSKGKAKGKNLGGVEGLIAGSDQYAVDNEEQEKRRKRQAFFGEEEEDFATTPPEQEISGLQHISAEYRAQVASGMAAGRTWTKGSCSSHRPREDLDEEEEEVTDPRGRRRAADDDD